MTTAAQIIRPSFMPVDKAAAELTQCAGGLNWMRWTGRETERIETIQVQYRYICLCM